MLDEKRGAEFIQFFWIIAIYLVILIFIVAGVSSFNSSKADIRLLEAETIGERITDYFIKNSDQKFFLYSQDEIFNLCNFNNEVNTSGYFYIKMTLQNTDGQEIKINGNPLVIGNQDIEKQCALKESTEKGKSELLGICSYHRVFVKYNSENGEENGFLNIKTGSNNHD